MINTSPISYYQLGRVYPRNKLRQPFIKPKRFLPFPAFTATPTAFSVTSTIVFTGVATATTSDIFDILDVSLRMDRQLDKNIFMTTLIDVNMIVDTQLNKSVKITSQQDVSLGVVGTKKLFMEL